MSIFQRGERLGSAGEERRYKIRVTTEDGKVLYWHKGGQLHVIDEDVARIFVANFKPEIFEVRADGSFSSSVPGETARIRKVEMVRLR